MEYLGGEVVYPTFEQCCDVNRRMIDSSGGSFLEPDNLINASALHYALDEMSASIFEHELYPTLKGKAAAVAYHILTRHPFRDGNKRTGIHMAWEFLRSNGIPIYLEPTIIDLAVSVANQSSDKGELLQWLHDHQQT